MNRILILLLITSSSFSAMASTPSWVKMMERENVNYYVTTKRFNRYWKHHLKPKKDIKNPITPTTQEPDPRFFYVKLFQSSEKAQQKSNALRVQYKNFKKWQLEMLPYVKSDGFIMTKTERIEAWQQLNSLNK